MKRQVLLKKKKISRVPRLLVACTVYYIYIYTVSFAAVSWKESLRRRVARPADALSSRARDGSLVALGKSARCVTHQLCCDMATDDDDEKGASALTQRAGPGYITRHQSYIFFLSRFRQVFMLFVGSNDIKCHVMPLQWATTTNYILVAIIFILYLPAERLLRKIIATDFAPVHSLLIYILLRLCLRVFREILRNISFSVAIYTLSAKCARSTSFPNISFVFSLSPPRHSRRAVL